VEAQATRGHVLLVDDDASLGRAVSRVLNQAGLGVVACETPEEVIEHLAADATPADVVLTDLYMPGMSGIDLLRVVRARHPEVVVLVMTGHAEVGTAVEAMRMGAYDYIVKPFDPVDGLVRSVQRGVEHAQLIRRNRYLERQVDIRERFEHMVGGSAAMRRVFELIESVAPVETTVLIAGESGTGKELVARAIHDRSPRRSRPFVGVNCAAITETLLESELFGHVRGAFTGATTARRGFFEEASSGTLFLDEIGDISPATQVRLLRALQEREVRPVGSNEVRRVETRVVAATNKDLVAAVRSGQFREDLYYRLNVISIELPPLRSRLDDLPVLAHHFVQKHSNRLGKDVRRLDPAVLELFARYRWPGNVRELEHAVERAVVLARSSEITSDLLPPVVQSPVASAAPVARTTHLPFAAAKDAATLAFERAYVEGVLHRADGNLAEAARLAGLHPSNFRRLMRRTGVSLPSVRDGAD
jgi:DNA-binding NtrC family response regulator